MPQIKTWLCPGCEATTVANVTPGLCPVCEKHRMKLWNIVEEDAAASRMAVQPDAMMACRWLEDRRETECVFCARSLADLDPQEYVGTVWMVDYQYAVGAACPECSLTEAAA